MDHNNFFQDLLREDRFQNDICFTQTGQIVGAGAGTGKTYQLVHKYLYELFQLEAASTGRVGACVERLVAITFTEKAALEMKERIRSALRELKAAYPAGARILDEVHRRMDGAYIGTIHSFCGRLLRENPGESCVDPQFGVLDEAESRALLRETARAFVDEGMRNNDPDICMLVDGYGYEGAEFVTGILDVLLGVYRAARTLGFGFQDILASHDEEMERLEPLFAGSVSALRRGVEFFINKGWPKLARNFSPLWERTGTSLVTLTLDAATPDHLTAIRRLGEATGGNWGKGDASAARKEIIASLEALEGMILDRLSRPYLEQVQLLLLRIDERYRQRKRELSGLDFNDLESETMALLSGHPAIAREYRRRFALVLVDEFQDTNPLQYAILQRLVEPGENRLFAVGDHKQSIYGFRGADVAIFNLLFSDHSPLPLRRHTLPICRRSTRRLVEDFFNPFFRSIMGEGPAEAAFASRYTTQDAMQPHRPTEGVLPEAITFFDLPPLAPDIRLAEARAIARRIESVVGKGSPELAVTVYDRDEKPRRACYRDIAVLFRSLKNVEPYLEALRRGRIPHYLVKGKGFFQSVEVADLIDLLAFLNYAGEEVPLVGVLRSPLVCVSDETVYRLRWQDDEPVPLDRYFREAPLPFPLSIDPEDRGRLERFREWFRELASLRDRLLISEIIERAVEKSGVDGVYAGGFQGGRKLANIHKLIELARRFERRGTRSLRDFVLYLRELMEAETAEAEAETVMENDDVVRIMTVHQAKGLQFPVVIVADPAGARTNNERDFFLLLPGRGLILKPPDPDNGVPVATFRWDEARGLRLDMEREELKRLLYVACTRARDHLILSGIYRPKGAQRSATEWLRHLLEYFGLDEEEKTSVDGPGCTLIPHAELPEAVKRTVLPVSTIMETLKSSPPPVFVPPPELAARLAGVRPAHRPMAAFTATDVNLFRVCPRHYFFQRILGLPHRRSPGNEEPSIEREEKERGEGESNAAMGTLLHWVLEHAPFDVGKEELLQWLEQGVRTLDMKAPERGLSGPVETVARALELPLFSSLRAMDVRKERPFVLSVKNGDESFIIKGTMDLLARDDKRAVIIDYKYAAPKKGVAWNYDMQLAIYGAAAAREGLAAEAWLLYLKPDPPLLDRRVAVRPEDDATAAIAETCSALLERERKTLESTECKALELWEPNRDICAFMSCGFLDTCRSG